MVGCMADDDLDALLDEAVESIRQQDSVIEKERLANEAEADSLLKAALGENGDDPLAECFGKLLGVLQRGPDALEAEGGLKSMEELIGKVMSTLEGSAMSGEDREGLESCRKMLDQLKDGESLDPNSEVGKELEVELEKLRARVGDVGVESSGPGEESAPNPLENILHDMMRPEVLRDPFIALRDAFGPWLEANEGSCSDEDRARFREQYRLATKIAGMLEGDGLVEVLQRQMSATGEEEANAETKALLDTFTELVSELQAQGAPPENLFEKK